jgi:soluble lytic murein transglycosylase-like protein
VKLIALALVVAAPTKPVPFRSDFEAVAGPRWLDRAAQVRAESAFKITAVSQVGAQGLAQFMPRTWTWAISLGWVPPGSSPFEPVAAITAQHAYMAWLEARVGGRWEPALGGYNAGLGSVLKAQRLANSLGLEGSDAWLRALPRITGRHAAETQGYIRNIRAYRAEYRAIYEGGQP